MECWSWPWQRIAMPSALRTDGKVKKVMEKSSAVMKDHIHGMSHVVPFRNYHCSVFQNIEDLPRPIAPTTTRIKFIISEFTSGSLLQYCVW